MTWCGFYLQIGNMTCGVCRKIRSIEEGFAHALLSIALLLFRAQSGTKPELHSRLRTGPRATAARYRMPAWVQRQQQSKGLDTEKCVKLDRPMATPLKHDWNTRIKTMYNIIFGIYIYICIYIYLYLSIYHPILPRSSQDFPVWVPISERLVGNPTFPSADHSRLTFTETKKRGSIVPPPFGEASGWGRDASRQVVNHTFQVITCITPFSPALHKISRAGSQFLKVWLGIQHFHQLIIHG